MGDARRLSEVDVLRLRLAREVIESSALRLRLAEQDFAILATQLGLSVGDSVTDDGAIITPLR
jgi:hypothetical protein